MKIKFLLATIFLSLASLFVATPTSVHASANSFSFDSFTGDYYVTKNADNTSSMHVKEEFVAKFPSFDQNHGIERYIPFTNLGGSNLTIPNQSAFESTLSVTRNGVNEPYSITRSGDFYILRIGNAGTYVHDKQTYVLEYDFQNVISEFNDNGDPYQELYWNTNGTDWLQPFGTVTARIHLPTGVAIPSRDNVWCYVGTRGSSNQKRCQISATSDGYTFTTNKLSSGENLTYDLEFPADTFTIPAKPDSYLFVVIAILELAIIATISVLLYRKIYLPIREKYQWLKTAPTPPQYSPLKDYTAAELGEIFIDKHKKDSRIATLLELTVQHKITLIKGEKHKIGKKYHWSIRIDNLDNISNEQKDLLDFLTDNKTLTVGEIYPLEAHTYSKTLENTYQRYNTSINSSLKQSGDLITDDTTSRTNPVIGTIIVILIILIPILLGFFGETIFKQFSFFTNLNYFHVVASWLLPIIIVVPIAAIIIHICIYSKFSVYKKYTQQGLEHSNYVAGLKLYIEMAEADRIKFLQSVEGADTSDQGIVKLYEKLLPYAALFGLEQSWLDEMAHYYELADISRPDWYDVGLAYAFAHHDFTSSFSRPVDPSSSSSSGSGGGGFSGGGGGGGGGGGW